MNKHWQGPSEALKAISADPLAIRLHRRAGEQGISYDTDHLGQTASVYRVEKRKGELFRIDLGAVQGGDPINTFINVALAYTAHDPELLGLIAWQIERRTDEVISALRYLNNKLLVLIEDIEEAHQSLAHNVGA